MQNEMSGYAELKNFNDSKKKQDDMNTTYIKAAVERKNAIIRMTPAEIGKMQAIMYSRAMYMAGWSGERFL